ELKGKLLQPPASQAQPKISPTEALLYGFRVVKVDLQLHPGDVALASYRFRQFKFIAEVTWLEVFDYRSQQYRSARKKSFQQMMSILAARAVVPLAVFGDEEHSFCSSSKQDFCQAAPRLPFKSISTVI